MNAVKCIIVAGVALAMCGGVQADVFTFTGEQDNTWNEDGNWEDEQGNPGTPGSTDTAIIPANKGVRTDAEDAGCKILEIAQFGHLNIDEGSTFTIHGGSSPDNDSTVDGTIDFRQHASTDDTPILKIMNSTTIKGDTGAIRGGVGFPRAKGVVRGNTASTILTLENSGEGNGLYLSGEVDVEVKLVNDSRVLSGGNTITLKTYEKSGTGLWEVDSPTGTMNVDVELSGTGNLWMYQADGALNINADCPNFAGYVLCGDGTFTVNNELATSDRITVNGGHMILNDAISMTGDLHVFGGTLTVNENFCTTGDMEFGNYPGGYGGTIVVAGGTSPKSAVFGGSCP